MDRFMGVVLIRLIHMGALSPAWVAAFPRQEGHRAERSKQASKQATEHVYIHFSLFLNMDVV